MVENAGNPDDWTMGPSAWEADVVLRDGSVAHIRPIRGTDGDLVREFHAAQSDESIYFRFFAPMRELSDRDVYRFTHVDHRDRVALVATVLGRIVGIGRFDRLDSASAEVAFNISDHFQGRGIGSILLEHLAAIASEMGIRRFVAEVLPSNRKMLGVFREAGYETEHHFEDGVVGVSFDIAPTEQSRAVAWSREHRAESVSMRALLFPQRVAIIGASRRKSSIGSTVLANLVAGGFVGELSVVNRHVRTLQGRRSYPNIAEVPGPVDLAIICVPADGVLEVVHQCAEAQVRAVLVVSGGFAESGPEGEQRQDELRREARRAGIRVIGPNSFGIINTDPSIRLNATLAPHVPPAGRLGLFAQSGALGIAVLASAARRNLGVSTFASAGNRVDVSGNDLMQYWIDDDETRTVGLYLESMGNPRKFSRIARHLAAAKPVIVVATGVSTFGTPPGHRTRTPQVPRRAFTALLKQAGVIRVENVHQLFDIAQLTINQNLPRGKRVAVVGNSDALGALSAGAAQRWGLQVTHGPVSIPAEADASKFAKALRAAFDDPKVDAVIASFMPPVRTLDEDVTAAVRAVVAKNSKPIGATFLGMRGLENGLTYTSRSGRDRAVPLYPMPEDAIRALASVSKYAAWRAKDRGTLVAPLGTDRDAAERLLEAVLADAPEGRALSHDEARQLLATYGIDLWPAICVDRLEGAITAAEALGYPVILKSASPSVRHQPGLAGVVGDITDAEEVATSFAALQARLGALDDGNYVIQRMAVPGVSCVLRKDEDPLFGPVISFSVAGPPTELLDDVAYRIPPLTDVDVSELMTSVKAAPLLDGHRGATPVDRDALAELIGRLATLGDDHPELAVVELNPVNAWAGGADVLGARIEVRPAAVRKDAGRRAMT